MKNNFKKFFGALIIAAVIIGVFLYAKEKSKTIITPSRPSATSPEAQATYNNETYSYSFSYPEKFSIKEDSQGRVLLFKKILNSEETIAQIEIVKGSNDQGLQSFEEFVLDQVRVLCSTTTAQKQVLCTRIDDVVKIAPFTTASGIAGQVFYLKADQTDASGSKKSLRKGPFYTFNTSLRTPNFMSFILISNPVSKSAEEADKNVLNGIANSLKFN